MLSVQRVELICPTGTLRKILSSPLCKNISLHPSGKSSLQIRAIPPHKRGVSRSSRTRGGMRWTRQRFARDGIAGRVLESVSDHRRADERCCCGRQNRVVLTPRRWRQVLRSCVGPTGLRQNISADDGGKRARSPGRARHKPLKPLRAGMPGDSGVLVVARVRSTTTKCTRNRGCSGHPAFPTPSKGRKINAQLGRFAPRDRGCASDEYKRRRRDPVAEYDGSREERSQNHPVMPRHDRPALPLLPTPGIVGILPANSDAFERRKKRSGQGTHTMKLSRIGVIVGAWLALFAAPGAGLAQENFPSRPVRIVIPYSAGSVADVFARIVAQNMAVQWNASIIVESKSGANGSIAAEEVARAAPDGYTWLLVTTFFTASPSLYAALRWDPVRDFIPVGQICRAPNFFIVPTTLPVKNVAEYVALAKAKPGTLNYSHPGKGSTGHLGFELFKRLAGIDVTAVGYRGYTQMVTDIARGLITSTFLSAEQGFAEAQVTPWFGVVVPAGTPGPIVERISKALETALAISDVQQKLDIAGCQPMSAPLSEFADIIKADVALWAKVVKDAGITADFE